MISGRVVAALCALVLTASTLGVSPAASAADDPVRILLVGDSITQGGAGDWTWRYRLWKHFEALGTSVDFVGPRTDLYDPVMWQSEQHDYLDPDFDQNHAAKAGAQVEVQDVPIEKLIGDHHPDVVVVALGINDLASGSQADVVAQRMRNLLAKVRAADPTVDLVLTRVPQTWAGEVDEFNTLLTQLGAELDSEASRVSVAYADDGFQHRVDTVDFVHQNAAGDLKIAAAMADAFAELGIGAPYPRPLPSVPLGPRNAPTLSAQAGDGQARLTWSSAPGAVEELV